MNTPSASNLAGGAYPSLPPNLVVQKPSDQLPRTEPPHQLSLRVMRLSKPSLSSLTQAPVPPPAPENLYHRALLSNQPQDDVQLTLPATFGNIYLGETFPAYVALTNDAQRDVARDVAVKIELQTVTQRFLLVDTTQHPKPLLNPLELIEFLLKHDIKELGIHVLVCSVHYTAKWAPSGPSGPTKDERRFFRKFYKFQVLNPLAVKTKVNSRVDGRVFLEVQVQNITSEPMSLDRLHMDPVLPFKVRDLNTVIPAPIIVSQSLTETSLSISVKGATSTTRGGSTTGGDSTIGGDGGERGSGGDEEEPSQISSVQRKVAQSVFGETEFLHPQDIRQYLYLLTPRTPDQLLATLRSNLLGKLDIVWRFPFGETGRLQTSQLTRRVPVAELIQVVTLKVYGPVRVESPFRVELRIVNRTDALMKIQISAVKAKMGAVLLRGQASRTLGEIQAGSHIDTTLEFLPLMPGLHPVAGIRVSDYISGESRDVELAEVFVQQMEIFPSGGDDEEEGCWEVPPQWWDKPPNWAGVGDALTFKGLSSTTTTVTTK